MNRKLFAAVAACLVIAASFGTTARAQESSKADRMPVHYDLNSGFVVTYENGHRGCRIATDEELVSMKMRAPGEELHVINPEAVAKTQTTPTTFTIVLRGTSQLETFPAAKAAFIRAAETWMALIKTPITVVIDVDFGPKRFGENYPPGVLGSTSSQFPDFGITYSSMRGRLISKAVSQPEKDLLMALPPSAGVPTSDGNCTLVYIATIPLRALGYLDAVADPDGEFDDLGDPPAIGFNSIFNYDFDPSDGVGSNQQDFNATALHEIGHALGFVSHVGLKELVPSNPNLVSTWDLFRFRPGVSISNFDTAERVTDAGGEQIEFTGGGNTRLSTGRPDGSGGDGEQASHWKDNVKNGGVYIGIMDPTGADGDLDELTPIDLSTLDVIGHDVKGMVTLDSSTVRLGTNNLLSLSSQVTVANRKLRTVKIRLFDSNGAVLASTQGTSTVNGDVQPTVSGTIDITQLLAAARIELVYVDDKGNESPAVVYSFAQPDVGGPTINTINYNGKKLIAAGTGFQGGCKFEVNGNLLNGTVKVKNGKKASLKGTAAALGLVSGVNRIRILQGDLYSTTVFLSH